MDILAYYGLQSSDLFNEDDADDDAAASQQQQQVKQTAAPEASSSVQKDDKKSDNTGIMEPRWGHSSSITLDGIFVFSGDKGWDESACKLDDVWALSFGFPAVELVPLKYTPTEQELAEYSKLYDERNETGDVTLVFQPPRRELQDNEQEQEQPQEEQITFKAHKRVLMPNCEYFANAMSSGMSESVSNTLLITDISLETLEAILHFCYFPTSTELREEDEAMALDILMGSNVYDVARLKNMCEKCIVDNQMLRKDNIVDVYRAAVLANAEQLRLQCAYLAVEHKMLKEVNQLKQEYPKQMSKDLQLLARKYMLVKAAVL